MGGCILRLFQGIHPLLSLITSERWAFRALKMRPVRQVLFLARYASENASRTPGGCPQSVESAVLRAFENASRTTEGCFWHRISLPYRRSLFFTPNASENASRTTGSLFEHGTHIPYRRRPYPVPNARHRGRLPPQRSLAYILVDLFLLVSVYDYRFGIGIELLFRFVERLQKRVSGALVSNGGGRTVSRIHLYRWVEKNDLFHY